MEDKVGKSKSLIERVLEDIKEDPERLDDYLRMLADSGMLKNVKAIKLKKVSLNTLKALKDNGTVVIFK